MNLKVNGEYLDFNGEIEVEKKIKLFEEISTSDGDVSFSFDIPRNPKNLKILTYPLADVSSKQIYEGLACDIINFGNVLYSGMLRVESITDVISCSFISGNSNWFALITGNLLELDFSEFDEEFNSANIIDSWARDSGVKYPIVDSGSLALRNTNTFVPEDFVPFIYVKTVFKKIFNTHGIKIRGELMNDPIYNKLMMSANNKDASGITTRTTYAGKTSTQAITATEAPITFPVETDPYSDGSENLWNGSRYTADVKMYVDISISFTTDYPSGIPANPFAFLYKNSDALISLPLGDDGAKSMSLTGVLLDAGDYIELTGDTFSGTFDVTDGSIRITPSLVYFTYGEASLPAWTQQKFISNILRMFNVIPAYDHASKTVTFNLFEKIKDKTPIDISSYVKPVEVNFERFVGSYAKKNLLIYQQPDIEEIDNYNKQNQFKYGTGVIEVDNSFIEQENDMIESDFSVPFGYVSSAFGMHMERININDFRDIRNFDITQVNDDSGEAEIVVPTGHGIEAGDIVLIEDSNVLSYNGRYVVSFSDATTIQCAGMGYISDADLKLTHQRIVRSSNSDVFLMIDSGPWDITDFSSISGFIMQAGILPIPIIGTDPSFVFFDMIDTGKQVNDFFKSSLSFGRQGYQRPLIENYWRLFNSILNDPVSPTMEAYLPLSVFMNIDFLAPLQIKTVETSNLYYANRMTGYKGQKLPCEIELIKL